MCLDPITISLERGRSTIKKYHNPNVLISQTSNNMEGEQKSNDQVNSLLMVNGLDYRLPPTLSVAVSRSHASYAGNQQVYGAGSTMNVTLSSGAQYVNFRESYLHFTVNMSGLRPADEYQFSSKAIETQARLQNSALEFLPGKNGVMNCFNSFRWVHSSGTLLEEFNQDMALWNYVRDRYTLSSDKTRSHGSLMDYQTFQFDVKKFTPGEPSHKFIVPMSLIADCFNQQQLAPSFLVAGSRLEIRLNSLLQAFVKTDAAAPIAAISYNISDVSCVLQQIQLTDSIVRALSNISASSGLEYPFTSIAVNSTTSSNSSGSIQVSRALSRANAVVVVRREIEAIDGLLTAPGLQSFAPSDKPINEYSAQLGGQTIPLSPITTQEEAFWHAMVCFGSAYDASACVPVSIQNFKGDSTAKVSDAIYCVSLETSSTLNQSGAALSSQRVLVFTYKVATPTASRYTMFTPHVRLVTCFLDSAIVRS